MQQKQQKQDSTRSQPPSKGSPQNRDWTAEDWANAEQTPTYRPFSALTPEEQVETMAAAKETAAIILANARKAK
jgi:hypothetical protein